MCMAIDATARYHREAWPASAAPVKASGAHVLAAFAQLEHGQG